VSPNAPDEITALGRIPVTSVCRTLLDLGAVSGRAALEAALTDALRQGLTTVHKLERYLGRIGGKGRRGANVLRSILHVLEDGSVESILELRLLSLLRRHRLPEPLAQFNIRRNSVLVARVDFAYPYIKLALETDGYRYHKGFDAWRRDLERRNALTALGWHVIHITWRDLSERPKAVAQQIRDAIQALSDASLGSEQTSLLRERR
jgi:very-short-patch-repair endonuclease